MISVNRNKGSAAARGIRSDDFLVAEQPIVGMHLDEVECVLNRLSAHADGQSPSPLDLSPTSTLHRRRAVGLRRFLPEAEGVGYWDFFNPADHLLVSVTDATYRQDQWIPVTGRRFFKLRLLLSGRLLGPNRDVQVQGPQGLLHLSPGASEDGYFVAGGQETKLVVLHCRPELLVQSLGLDPSDLPPPLDTIEGGSSPSSMHRIGLGPEAFHAAQRIVDSRHGVPRALRAAYLESMAMAILCEVLGELSNHDLVRRAASRLNARDLNRIYEARDYLAQHFVAPPMILPLARMVGINQTKLKAGFKEVLGLTIYQYILQCRMERACELLLAHDCSVAEIAYKVGYEYPANFTCAFKRRFGCLPRAWRRSERQKTELGGTMVNPDVVVEAGIARIARVHDDVRASAGAR